MVKLPPITDEEWEKVCEFNRTLYDDYFANSAELSPKTIKAYKSNLKIWFVWVMQHLSNKRQIDVKPLEFKKFQNWLITRGSSASDIYNKRSAVSALNIYIETYYADDEECKNFRNFINKSIKRPTMAFVNEKKPLTKEEFSHLISVLEEREEWQKIAYLKFTFETGCRKAESMQIRKDIVNAKPNIKTITAEDADGNDVTREVITYLSPPIRCKGAGKVGKVRRMKFGQSTMDAFKRWLEVRGEDDCPYMFVSKYGGSVKQVSENCFNSWSKNTFAPIVGRRFHPHLLRESRATSAVVEDGIQIEKVSKLLGHNDIKTTSIYVIRDDSEEIDDLFE